MSEAQMLVKQLEYCLNSGYMKPAEILISELIHHKATLNYSFKMEYKCSSHVFNFNCEFKNDNINDFYLFRPCNHLVCYNCLGNYITTIFTRCGLAFNYICPGCSANYESNQTRLDFDANYFTYFVPKEVQEKWKADNDIATMTLKQAFYKPLKSRCFFFKYKDSTINCQGVDEVIIIPGCKHRICKLCIYKSLEMIENDPPFKCFAKSCNQMLADQFVKDLIPDNNNLFKKICPKLRLDEIRIFSCPSCKTGIQTSYLAREFSCSCGSKLCPMCGNFIHGDIPCAFVNADNFDYLEQECTPNDPDPQFRSFYYQALGNFLWDLHTKKKLELMANYNIKFNVLKVFRIINPALQQRYDKAKSDMIKNGIDPNEKYVFHGTQDKFYSEICKNGFKIGGIDIDIAIGKVYGYGVYTATDPTMSIHYYHNKKIIMCKGLTGLISNSPINDKDAFLKNTQFHSYFKDFHDLHSNFYVFFKTDYVLPYYLITYE